MNKKIKICRGYNWQQLHKKQLENLEDGDILVLDNLRLCAEENYEFSPENAAKTIMVSSVIKTV